MIERYPAYYERFRCIADKCEDTCCAGWEIDIDDETYEKYMRVPGEFGARLRVNIAEYDDLDEDMYEQHGFVLTEEHRCPFLDERGLCDIYRELGESALCEVCTNTPRNYMEYGGAREISISASCPESARLIYEPSEKMEFTSVETDEEFPFEEDEDEIRIAEFVRQARDQAIEILQDRDNDIKNRIEIFLSHAKMVQDLMNADRFSEISLENITKLSFSSGFLLRFGTFSGLASIGEAWKDSVESIYALFVDGESDAYEDACQKLESYMLEHDRMYEYEHLLVYYAFLLLPRCVDDMDYLSKAKLVVLSYLMQRDMDAATLSLKGKFLKEDRETNARIYAREVEHAEENMADIYEEILFEKALLDIFVKKM